LQIEDGIAVLRFQNSEDALLSLSVLTELADLLDSAGASRNEVSIVVLTGADGKFVPDVDRGELARRVEGEEVSGDASAWSRAVEALTSLPQPTVAAIDGEAVGGGSLLALACTLRIGSERSVFGPVELDFGIVGTESSAYLVRLVGKATAAELLLTRRELDAATAKEIGLINEVLPSEGFDAQVREWCQKIASLEPATVFAVKQALERSTPASRDDIVATLPPASQTPALP
jgi:enoyl-CoA hydratase